MNVIVGKTAVDTQRKRLFPNLTVLNFPWVKYIDTIPAERFNSQTKLLKVLTIKVWKKSVNILYSFSVVLHCLGEKISTMFSGLDSIFFFNNSKALCVSVFTLYPPLDLQSENLWLNQLSQFLEYSSLQAGKGNPMRNVNLRYVVLNFRKYFNCCVILFCKNSQYGNN